MRFVLACLAGLVTGWVATFMGESAALSLIMYVVMLIFISTPKRDRQ